MEEGQLLALRRPAPRLDYDAILFRNAAGDHCVDLSIGEQSWEWWRGFAAHLSEKRVRSLTITNQRNLTRVPDFFLLYCESLTRVNLSQLRSVTSIGYSFMRDCSGICEVDLSHFSNVLDIGDAFLSGCRSMVAIDLGGFDHKITVIPDAFLESCSGLTSIDLFPLRNVRTIGHALLRNCSGLLALDLAPFGNVITIGDAFLQGASSLIAIDLAPLTSLQRIGEGFLCRCSSVTSVNLAALCRLSVIPDAFLSECSSLSTVNLEPLDGKVEWVGDSFLRSCNALPSVDLHPLRSAMHLGEGFLADCSRLTRVNFTALVQVREVGTSLLLGCTELTEVLVPAANNALVRACTAPTVSDSLNAVIRLVGEREAKPSADFPSSAARVKTPKNFLHEVELRIAAIKRERDASQHDARAANARVTELEGQNRRLDEERVRLQLKTRIIRSNYDAVVARNATVEAEVVKLNTALMSAQSALAASAQTVAEQKKLLEAQEAILQKTREEHTATVALREEQSRALESDLKALRTTHESTVARCAEVENSRTDLQQKLAYVTSALHQREESESLLRHQLDATSESLRKTKSALDDLHNSYQALEAKHQSMKTELLTHRSTCAAAVQRNETLTDENTHLNTLLSEVRAALQNSDAATVQMKSQLETEILDLQRQLWEATHIEPIPQPAPRALVGVDCFSLHELSDVRPLGSGGFGSVMLVRTQPKRGARLLAMKVPFSFQQLQSLRAAGHLSELSSEELRSASRDFRIASRMRHPNIVPFAGLVGTMEEPIGMLMEYVDGGSLYDAVVRTKRRPSLCEFLRIAVDLTSAVAHLHVHSVWHRDIKPQNVLIDSRGHIYLADFGSAARGDVISDVTEAPTSLGVTVPQTTKYLDPDMNREGPGDVYALGLTLLEVCLGRSLLAQGIRSANRETPKMLSGLFQHLLLDSYATDRDSASTVLQTLTSLQSRYVPYTTAGAGWTEDLPQSWLPLGSSATVFLMQHLPPSLAGRIPVLSLCAALSPDGAGAFLCQLPALLPHNVMVIPDIAGLSSIPGKVVVLVRNVVLEGSFEARMRLLRSRSTAYYDANGSACASWKDDTLVDGSKLPQHHLPDVLGHRDAVMTRLNDRVWKPFPANVDGDPVRVALLFHATTLEAALQIADAGFMSYARLDSGYFGKGLYFTPDFAYARDVYAADMLCDGKRVAIIAAYVCVRHVFPCVDMSMKGKSNRGGYDAHAAVVVQKSPTNVMVYEPVKNGEWKTNWNGLTSYVEVVVFDCAQALPAALFVLE